MTPHDADHHDHERIVELLRVPSIVEAQGIVAELEGQGITATTSSDDAGGLRPNLTFAQGYGVLVFEHDRERAQQIVNDLDVN